MVPKKTFHLVLIKPSHYDDDGYVIQWRRSAIPSNSLAALNAIAMDCAHRQVLGDDVQIVVEVYDETNTVLPMNTVIRTIRKASGGLVGLVGVQTNQFARAVDLGTDFLNANVPVILGGFHISGCFSMLPDIPLEIQEALDRGLALFAGEAEGHLEEVLKDTHQGQLQRVYNFLSDSPSLSGAPAPFLPVNVVKKHFSTPGQL